MRHALVVSGLGRCGSSLVMQMLDAAGVLCFGSWPSFEGSCAEAFLRNGMSPALWKDAQGCALKALVAEPRPIAPAPPGSVVIWLRRDPREQARSQAKFASFLLGLPRTPGHAALRRWARDLERDQRAAIDRWRASGAEVRSITYEELIGDPRATALRLCQVGRFGFTGATVEAMAACVRKTDARCAPDVGMELTLLAERQVRATRATLSRNEPAA